MSVHRIIQESIEKNPLGLKEAFAEELTNRIRLALEAKMNDEDEEDDALDEISMDLAKEVRASREVDAAAARGRAGIIGSGTKSGQIAMAQAAKHQNKADKTSAIIAKRLDKK